MKRYPDRRTTGVDKSAARKQEATINRIIDTESPVPPYEQLRRGIAAQIDTGELEPDTRLPTVRELASQMGVANNTAAKAYRELEAGGYIRTEGRRGTFVAARSGRSGNGAAHGTGEDALSSCMSAEMSLLRPGSFPGDDAVAGWFDDEFTLVSADGHRLSGAPALAALRADAREPSSVEGLQAEYLGPSVVLLAYLTRRGPAVHRHSTVWVRSVSGWRCRHRQSTPVRD